MNLKAVSLILFLLYGIIQAQEGLVKNAESGHTQYLESIEKSYAAKNFDPLKDNVWDGTLDKHIPVRVRFHQFDTIPYGRYGNLVTGSITYLNTKAKTPIPLLGYVDEDGNFYVREFQKNGNISGIIEGKANGKNFIGEWIKPYTFTAYKIHLTQKDTLISTPIIKAKPTDYTGDYYYQYGKKGPLGEWSVRTLGNGKIEIQASSVTHAPARNIADIEKDTVALQKNSFSYTVKSGSNCEIDMQAFLFKDFMLVYYTNKDPCLSFFGHNATLEGIYYKIK